MILEQSVGIDFRENLLRLVRLGKGLRGTSLIDHMLKKYPFSIDKNTPQEKMDELVTDIRDFSLQHGKADHIVLGIPREKVTLRQITLPSISKEQLQDMISYEVKRHIPIPQKEVYFDYNIANIGTKDNQTIFLGLVRQDDLDFYLNLLERAQLIPTLATISSFGLSNKKMGINSTSKDNVELFIDLGDGLIECLAMQEDRFLFAKTLEMDEGHLVDDFSISQKNVNEKIDQEEIEGNLAEKLGFDLINSLSYSFGNANLEEEISIKKISITGLDAYNIPISDYFKDKTDVSVPNPFNQMTMSQIPGRTASALAIATGLARRGFDDKLSDLNLLPPRLQIKKSSSSFKFSVVLIIIFLILGIGIAYIGNPISFPKKGNLASVFSEHQVPAYCFYLPKKLKLMEIINIRDHLKPKVREVKDIDQKIDMLGDEVSKIHDLMEYRSKIEILRELTNIIPEEAWLDRADIDNDKIEIRGRAESAAGLIGVIEQSPFFENVDFPTTISTKRGTNKEIFRINADIEVNREAE